MTKYIFKISICLMAAFAMTGCLFSGPTVKGDGNVVEQERDLGKFENVKVSNGINVVLTNGENTKVMVVADKNLQDIIETKVVGSTLEIRALSGIFQAASKKVLITVPDLNQIDANSGSNVATAERFEAEKLTLRATAGSSFDMEIEGDDLNVSLSAGSNAVLRGKVNLFVAKSTAGANIKAEELKAEISKVKVSSGSNAWINVKREISAHASSGGNIFYYGTPEKSETTSSSGGNVQKR